MQDNTYDILPFKFGVMIQKEKIFFVPFENFDGLTVEEILKATKAESINFTCYSEYDNLVTGNKDMCMYYTLLLPPAVLKEKTFHRLDKLIEEDFKKILRSDSSPYTYKRVAKCFLQRTCMAVSRKLEQR